MISQIWFLMIAAGVLTAAGRGQIDLVTQGALQGAEQAVTVAFGLVGIIAFWSGMMRIAQDAGLIELLSRAMTPLARKLFPEVPPNHPAMGALLLSMSANLLGLGNACTPLGLKAMEHLQELNKTPNTATNSMCTFLTVTSSSLTIIPGTVIAFRAAHGSTAPTAIIGTTLVATLCSTLAAIITDRILRRIM